MRAIRWVALGVAAVVAVTFAEPPTQPSTQPAKRAMRLVQPWSKVTDLSDEQKEQLGTIHAEITDRINALRDEEHDRCMSILSAEQKAALEATLARESAERKARAAERKSPKGEKADKN